MNHRFFASTAKGIEPVLAEEIRDLGLAVVEENPGGVVFRGTMADGYRANLWLRTANRVLLQIAEFPCRDPQELYARVHALNWTRYLTPRHTLAVRCATRDSAITHSNFAALTIKDAVVDRIRERHGTRPDVNRTDPDVGIHARILRNVCTIALDTSGHSLHQRGYRPTPTPAPLKENLAAAIIRLTGWSPEIPLIDPMCGSGTLLIEAALQARNFAPGLLRPRFGFMRWPGYDRVLFNRQVEEARNAITDRPGAPIIGYDEDEKAISVAREAARRAQVEDRIEFDRRDMRHMKPPTPPGILVVNPPYGERLGELEKLAGLYRALGDTFKHRGKGYTAYIFTGNLELAKEVGLRTSRRVILYNGAIECRLLEYRMY